MPVGVPGQQDRAPGHLHAGRRLHPGRRSRSSARPSRTSGRRRRPTAPRARTGAPCSATASASSASWPASRSPTGSSTREEQRAFYRIGDDGELEAVSDYDMQYGTQRRSSASSATSSYQFTLEPPRLARELLHPQRPRRGPVLRGAEHREQLLLPELPPAVHRGGPALERRSTGEHFFQGLAQQPLRLARELRPGQPRRAGPARDALPGQPGARRRGNFTPVGNFLLADESQSGFRMFNELDDETLDVAANWSVLQSTGGRPTQYKFGVNFIDRDPRLLVAPLPLHPERGQPVRRVDRPQPGPDARGALHGGQHRPRVPVQRGDAPRGRLRRATRPRIAGYGMVDIALSRAVPPDRRRPRRATSTRRSTTFDPFGLFDRDRPRRRTRTPTSSRRSTGCSRCARTRTSGSATAPR